MKIGSVSLEAQPVIVLTVTDRESLAAILKAGRLGARVLELRIDRFRKISPDAILQRIRSLRKLRCPLIATIRSAREGGGRAMSDAKRLELFKKILPEVQAIDLELGSARLVKALVPRARRQGKRVILSYHNFNSAPPDRALERCLGKGKRAGADVVKIAVTPKKSSEVNRLLQFTERHRDDRVVVIGMGRIGAPTRILAPLFGSLLTYTFIGRSHAPGQLPLRRLAWELGCQRIMNVGA